MHQNSNPSKNTALKRDSNRQLLLAFASFLLLATLLCGCNPYGYKDTHPEVPVIDELLKDTTAFVPMRPTFTTMISLLQDDRIWETQDLYNDSVRYKLYSLGGKVHFEYIVPRDSDYYMDSLGNIYLDQKFFPYPDFKPVRPLEMIFLEDTLSLFLDSLREHCDGMIAIQRRDSLRVQLMQHYGLTDCSPEEVLYEKCAYIAIDHKRLIAIGQPWRLNFLKPMQEVRTFDAPSGISRGGGRMGYSHHTYYFELDNGVRFKSDDQPSQYLYTEVPGGLWLDFQEGEFFVKVKK